MNRYHYEAKMKTKFLHDLAKRKEAILISQYHCPHLFILHIAQFYESVYMRRGILIGDTGKVVFHNKIQQSGINIIRVRTSGARSNWSTNNIIIISIGKITQFGIFFIIATTQIRMQTKKRSDDKKANGKEGK